MDDPGLKKYLENAAAMGRSARFSMRRIMRKAGMTVEPGVLIYIAGERCERPPASLDWLPGEEEWNRERDAAAGPVA